MSTPLSPAFEEYVVARWARLVRAAVLLGADVHAAQDLVQSTLVKCYLHWDRVVRAQDPDAYVYRALVNTRLDAGRRRASGEVPVDQVPDVPGPAHDPLDDGARDAVRTALAGLPVDLRRVVVLRYYVDLTERATAEVLRIPVGTVKSRGSRALALLALDPALTDLFPPVPGGDR